jgi:hypothetical protein
MGVTGCAAAVYPFADTARDRRSRAACNSGRVDRNRLAVAPRRDTAKKTPRYLFATKDPPAGGGTGPHRPPASLTFGNPFPEIFFLDSAQEKHMPKASKLSGGMPKQ